MSYTETFFQFTYYAARRRTLTVVLRHGDSVQCPGTSCTSGAFLCSGEMIILSISFQRRRFFSFFNGMTTIIHVFKAGIVQQAGNENSGTHFPVLTFLGQ